MAIDTRKKRQSVVGNGKPWMGARVIADGTIDAADRATAGRTYNGIAIDAPPTPGGFVAGGIFGRRIPDRWDKHIETL